MGHLVLELKAQVVYFTLEGNNANFLLHHFMCLLTCQKSLRYILFSFYLKVPFCEKRFDDTCFGPGDGCHGKCLTLLTLHCG